MARRALILAALLVALASPAPAAAAPLVVGIGDQKADMFADARLGWLGIRHARLVVPWYLETHGTPAQREHVRGWLRAARRAGIEPLVGFGPGYTEPWRGEEPSRRQFVRGFAAFRRAYPWIRSYIVWNEANRCVPRACPQPRQVAGWFDAMRASCPRCRVLAGAFVTAPNLRQWLFRFRRAARSKPEAWALHNHSDINRLRWWRTRQFLRLVRGPVWLTEAGGLVWWHKNHELRHFPQGPYRAGVVTKFLLERARRDRARIERVYVYHWNSPLLRPPWDSGIVDGTGVARPAFTELARGLGRDPALAPLP